MGSVHVPSRWANGMQLQAEHVQHVAVLGALFICPHAPINPLAPIGALSRHSVKNGQSIVKTRPFTNEITAEFSSCAFWMVWLYCQSTRLSLIGQKYCGLTGRYLLLFSCSVTRQSTSLDSEVLEKVHLSAIRFFSWYLICWRHKQAGILALVWNWVEPSSSCLERCVNKRETTTRYCYIWSLKQR